MTPARDADPDRRLLVGLGIRSYNATYGYAGLPVPGVRFRRVLRLPLNRLAPESLTAQNTIVAFDSRVDLVHLMNGVLAGGWLKPWVTSFESMLPRVDARHRGGRIERHLLRCLLGPHCRAILAWSDQALRWLDAMHDEHVAAALRAKTTVFTGSTGPPVDRPRRHGLPLRVAFVGGELQRKGGVALLRAAAEAKRQGIPINVTVVGDPDAPTDVVAPFERYRAEARSLLSTVEWFPRLDAAAVSEVLAASHVLVLPSLQETLGWITLEAMQRGVVPVVAGIAVQRELVGDTGLALSVPTNDFGTWSGLDVAGPAREAATALAIDSLAEQILSALTQLANDADLYERLSAAALDRYRTRFDPVIAARRLRDVYDRALAT